MRPRAVLVVLAILVMGSLATGARAWTPPAAGGLGTGAWRFHTGDDPSYRDPGYDDSRWATIRIERGWQEQGFAGYYGYAWYRTRFDLTGALAEAPKIAVHLDQSGGYGDLWAYVNGAFLGATAQDKLDVLLPRELLHRAGNVLAVRVFCGGYEDLVPRYQACGLAGNASVFGTSTGRAGIPVSLTTSEPGGIADPGQDLILSARVTNTTPATRRLAVRFVVAGGGRTRLDLTRSARLASGQTKSYRAAFRSNVRGPYQARATVSDAVGAISSSSRVIGVADPPGHDRRFALNILNGDDVSATIGCQDLCYMDLARRSGALWIREQSFPWVYAQQRPNLLNWSFYDATYRNARRAGVRILWNVQRVPYWAIDLIAPTWAGAIVSATQPPHPEHYQAFAKFLAAAAARYPGSYWEIGNEPDNNLFPWYFRPEFGFRDHIAYLTLLSDCYRAIKAADPTATVVLGGMSNPEGPSPTDYAEDLVADRPSPGELLRHPTDWPSFFERVMKFGGARYFDVMNFHAYNTTRSYQEIDVTGRANRVREMMDRFGIGDRPMWLTEFNYSPPNPTDSRFAVRTVPELLANGVDRVFWFYTMDYPGEIQPYYGLFDGQGQPRPAFFTYVTLTHMVSGLHTIRRTTVDGIPAVSFAGPGRMVTVISAPEGTARIDVHPDVAVFDDWGNRVTPTKGTIVLDRYITYLVRRIG